MAKSKVVIAKKSKDAVAPALDGSIVVKAPPTLAEMELALQTYFREHPQKAKAIYDSVHNNPKLKEILAKLPDYNFLNSEKVMEILSIREEWL